MALIFSLQGLGSCNTLGLDAQVPMATLSDEGDVAPLCRSLARGAPDGRPLFILGGGSNVVVEPQPRHRVLRVALKGMHLWRETPVHRLVEVAAGESWHGFVAHCVAQGWGGLENLALIPGTVGAAPVQNIGAYGLELSERVHSIVVWDFASGQRVELPAGACRFGYRDSVFRQAGSGRWLITGVRFALPRHWIPRLEYPDLRHYFAERAETPGEPSCRQAVPDDLSPQRIFDAVCAIRRRKLPDPAAWPNAGSFFKNPLVTAARARELQVHFPALRAYPQDDGRVKLAAGWLIEQAGWKGRRLGPVGMHDRQALVMVNYGGATAADVHALAQAVRGDVRVRFGVDLEQEPVPLD